MPAPKGTFFVLNAFKRHYFDERVAYPITLGQLISEGGLQLYEIETILIYLKSKLAIGNFSINQDQIRLDLNSNFLSFRENFIRENIPAFESDSGFLSLKDKKIKFGEPGKNLHGNLLRVLFQDIKKDWHNDEIYEEWGYNVADRTQAIKAKRTYQAATGINKKLELSGFKNFLIFDTSSVRINPLYLLSL
jgi:hypothetical protein